MYRLKNVFLVFAFFTLLITNIFAQSPVKYPQNINQYKSQKSYQMGLGIGSVTLNGKRYNQISLRPEFSIGKLGIGLDMYVYLDEKGNIREGDWDEFSDYLKKIYYIRWGNPNDSLYARAGALEDVTMGYGILMDGYANTIQYPQVRNVGIHAGMKFPKFSWEAFVADINELDNPGLLGLRSTLTPFDDIFPIKFGASFVMDGNPYAGLIDNDGDGVPQQLDIYDGDDNQFLTKLRNNPGLVNDLRKLRQGGQEIPDSSVIKNGLPKIGDYDKKPAKAIAIDASYPILKMDNFVMDMYGQAASFLSDQKISAENDANFEPGWGYAFPGFRAEIMKNITAKVEYRYADKHFLFNFWNRNYDFERVQIKNTNIYTKQEMKLYNPNPAKGIYGSIRAELFDWVRIGSYYQHMRTSEKKIRSFQASISLNPRRIPRISEATAYYQRNNDENPFKFCSPSENTILGYRIGLEISEGANLYYVFKKSYRDTNGDGIISPDQEAVVINSIETGITF